MMNTQSLIFKSVARFIRKRATLFTFYFLLFTFYSKAQVNYVQNAALEKYSQCPDNWDEINYADYWSSLDSMLTYESASNGDPEYCNVCADTNVSAAIAVGVPENGYFYHYPH